MRKISLALGAALALVAAAPLAAAQHSGHGDHAAHVQTNPADGASGAAPQSFSVTFAHPMRLTALVITPRGGDPIAVEVAAGDAANTVSTDLPALTPGSYTFAWTATGADNHTMTGRVRYSVSQQ